MVPSEAGKELEPKPSGPCMTNPAGCNVTVPDAGLKFGADTV